MASGLRQHGSTARPCCSQADALASLSLTGCWSSRGRNSAITEGCWEDYRQQKLGRQPALLHGCSSRKVILRLLHHYWSFLPGSVLQQGPHLSHLYMPSASPNITQQIIVGQQKEVDSQGLTEGWKAVGSPGPRTEQPSCRAPCGGTPLPGPAAHVSLPGPGLWLLALRGVLCDGEGWWQIWRRHERGYYLFKGQ